VGQQLLQQSNKKKTKKERKSKKKERKKKEKRGKRWESWGFVSNWNSNSRKYCILKKFEIKILFPAFL
jgi:hypothetical protein